MTVDTPDGYERCARACFEVIDMAFTEMPIVTWWMDPFELWDQLDRGHLLRAEVGEEATVLQWVAAWDLARERHELPHQAHHPVAVIGAMCDGVVRDTARQLLYR